MLWCHLQLWCRSIAAPARVAHVSLINAHLHVHVFRDSCVFVFGVGLHCVEHPHVEPRCPIFFSSRSTMLWSWPPSTVPGLIMSVSASHASSTSWRLQSSCPWTARVSFSFRPSVSQRHAVQMDCSKFVSQFYVSLVLLLFLFPHSISEFVLLIQKVIQSLCVFGFRFCFISSGHTESAVLL